MTASARAVELSRAAGSAAADKLATDVIAIDVSEHVVITDVFLIASVANERQVRGVVDAIEERLHQLGVKSGRREGLRDGRWVLLDFGELVVHVQHREERAFYAIERLWKDCPTIPLDLEPAGIAAAEGEL
ncbi:MAG: ribosome silencing factor [Actinomycetes bacterium]